MFTPILSFSSLCYAGPSKLEKCDRSARFSTCIPLPTLYQEDFGPYKVIGGKRVRQEVKALRD